MDGIRSGKDQMLALKHATSIGASIRGQHFVTYFSSRFREQGGLGFGYVARSFHNAD